MVRERLLKIGTNSEKFQILFNYMKILGFSRGGLKQIRDLDPMRVREREKQAIFYSIVTE